MSQRLVTFGSSRYIESPIQSQLLEVDDVNKVLSDRTKFLIGRRRPFMLVSAAFLAAGFLLMYSFSSAHKKYNKVETTLYSYVTLVGSKWTSLGNWLRCDEYRICNWSYCI
jgi:hypothetical protein